MGGSVNPVTGNVVGGLLSHPITQDTKDIWNQGNPPTTLHTYSTVTRDLSACGGDAAASFVSSISFKCNDAHYIPPPPAPTPPPEEPSPDEDDEDDNPCNIGECYYEWDGSRYVFDDECQQPQEAALGCQCPAGGIAQSLFDLATGQLTVQDIANDAGITGPGPFFPSFLGLEYINYNNVPVNAADLVTRVSWMCQPSNLDPTDPAPEPPPGDDAEPDGDCTGTCTWEWKW